MILSLQLHPTGIRYGCVWVYFYLFNLNKKYFCPIQQETTSLAERIRLLTCDVEDEPEEQRSSPAGANADKLSTSSDKSSDKSFNSLDKNSEKAFGSASSSSSSSTLSAPVPNRQPPPDLGDVHQEPQKVRFPPQSKKTKNT